MREKNQDYAADLMSTKRKLLVTRCQRLQQPLAFSRKYLALGS
jgi:hypothetical protein